MKKQPTACARHAQQSAHNAHMCTQGPTKSQTSAMQGWARRHAEARCGGTMWKRGQSCCWNASFGYWLSPSDGAITTSTSFLGTGLQTAERQKKKKCSLTVSMPDRIESIVVFWAKPLPLSLSVLVVSRQWARMKVSTGLSQARLSLHIPDKSMNAMTRHHFCHAVLPLLRQNTQKHAFFNIQFLTHVVHFTSARLKLVRSPLLDLGRWDLCSTACVFGWFFFLPWFSWGMRGESQILTLYH